MSVRTLLMITATLCGISKTCSATNAVTLYEDCLKSCIEEASPIAKTTAQYNGQMDRRESSSMAAYRSFEKAVTRCASTTCTPIAESAPLLAYDHIAAVKALFFANLLNKIFTPLVDLYAGIQVEGGKYEELTAGCSGSKTNLLPS